MNSQPPPIDPSLLDPHKRSLRPGVVPPEVKSAVPTQPLKPSPKSPISSPATPLLQKSISSTAGATKDATKESKSANTIQKADSEQASATNETQKQPSPPPAGSKTTENETKQQPPENSSKQPNGKDGSGTAAWIAATIILALFVIVCIAASKNTEIENLKREIAQLTEREPVQERESNAQTRTADERAERIGRLEKLLAERNETIARKEREIARLEREKATLQSEIVDLQSDKSDALRRASSAESELASEMNRATAATNRAREAERRLAVAKSPSMKTTSQSPRETASEPKDAWVVVSATLDGKPVKGATLTVSDRTFSLPRKFSIRKGNKTKPGTVFYRRNGITYSGQMSSVLVDWTGEQKIVIPLTSKDSWDDDEFDLDRELRSSWGDDDPWTFP